MRYEIRVDGLTPANSRELAYVPGWVVQATYATYTINPDETEAARLIGVAGMTRASLAVSNAYGSVQNRMDEARERLGGRATEYTSLIAVRNKLRAALDEGHSKVRLTIWCEDCAETYNFPFTAYPAVGEVWAANVDKAEAAADEHRKAHGRAKLAEALAADVEESAARRGKVIELRRGPVTPSSSTIRNVRVRDDLWADCKTIAEARGETLSAVLVAALNDYRAKYAATVGPSLRIAGEQELPGMGR